MTPGQMAPTDVLICGGGIGGAVLAEGLARAGLSVLVLERNLKPPSFLRPELLWPATIATLCQLHPRADWERDVALPMRGIEARRGSRAFARIDAQDLASAGLQPWFVNPNEAREFLLRRASFTLRRGVEVVSVLKEGGRIVGVQVRDLTTSVTSELRAALVVGDDGERSVVRQGAGIPLETEPFPLEFLCFALEWPADSPAAVARVWINPRGGATGLAGVGAMPFVGGRGAGLALVRSAALDAAAANGTALAAAWRDLLALDADLARLVGPRRLPADMVRVRRSFGHAPRYGAPGALLLGDAAHPVSPAGGQGANMAIADARTLWELLHGDPSAVRKRLLSDGAVLLADYEARRRAGNERSVGISRTASRALNRPTSLPALSLRLAGLGLRLPAARRALLRGVATAFAGEPAGDSAGTSAD
ncbi:MAG: FAD-dependent monooxygenase [Planctomycetota bacterium]